MTEEKYSTNKEFAKAVTNTIGRALGYEIRFKPISQDYIKPKEIRGNS
jgi:hypothetical protein